MSAHMLTMAQMVMGGVTPWIRSFATFDGTDDDIVIPTVTATGDFELEFEFSTTDVVGSAKNIISSVINTKYQLLLQATTGVLFAKFQDSLNANVFLSIPATNWADGKLHKGSLTRVGDLFTLSAEGQSASTTEVGALNPSYAAVGAAQGGFEFFSGVLANINFKSGWDTNRFYALDEVNSNTARDAVSGQDGTYANFEVDFSDRELLTQQPNGDWLGVDLVSNGGMDTDTVWAKGANWTISGGLATHTAGLAGELSQAVTLIDGAVYRDTVTASGVTVGTVTPRFTGGTTVTGTAISGNGTDVQLLIADGGNITLGYNADSAFAGSLDDSSLERILEAP